MVSHAVHRQTLHAFCQRHGALCLGLPHGSASEQATQQACLAAAGVVAMTEPQTRLIVGAHLLGLIPVLVHYLVVRCIKNHAQISLEAVGDLASTQAAMAGLAEQWFRLADEDKDGKIGGAEAVKFFTRSGLPKDVLGQVR